ncbi:MAG: adenylate kinase [Desulfurella sp.]|uniref:Adenylate kinase n=1 Tax=Desulfurella multipotens TaxID=79269 RepID=A0A1G6KK89_9BACT|nr:MULTISPECIES: adenylate kinase [Desulfurella]PMP67930.1 MAG: adenylate kinase [Desulfurella multipotens]PMP91585.1 MAG: adenylate kinase [Desulfurella sp.]SDC30736.1 Adenylate kinase [Desulfurella multipotens]HEX14009.1 adenylate kinase [Desulfurella acetivorans]
MILILLGAPGVGKGTQSQNIIKKYSIVQISTGDILRNEVKNETELGLTAKQYMEKGELVPDDIIIKMIEKRISQPDCANGFLLDGFPRTIEQAKSFDKMIKQKGLDLDKVIYIDVADDEIIDRLTLRRVCPTCGAIYHLKNKPPKQDMICDICGSKLIQRSDDTKETVENRLKVFKEHTKPLIEYYEKQGKLNSVSGLGTVDEVFSRILTALSSI